ncbi:hypothetical protein HanPSC8_Chr14g0601561 [Helianthus annuus]|nr:hypothetical protein HanPSC8_Chr14g0601561 [Helianthus annuus]
MTVNLRGGLSDFRNLGGAIIDMTVNLRGGVKCKFLYKHAIRRLKRVFNWIPGILSSV